MHAFLSNENLNNFFWRADVFLRITFFAAQLLLDITSTMVFGPILTDSSQRWSSESSIRCRRPYGLSTANAGQLLDQAVIVTIHIQVGTLTDAFSFSPPILTAVTVGNAPTIGATYFTLAGLQIGLINYCPKLRPGGSAAESIKWLSDTSVAGKIAAGTKATLQVEITVGRRENRLTEGVSYDIPDITAPQYSYYSAALGALGLSPVYFFFPFKIQYLCSL